MRRFLGSLVVMLALVGSAACSSGGDDGSRPTGSGGDAGRAKVVVTTDILGDVTKQVVGSQADVEVVVPNGLAARNFEPAVADVNLVLSAQLVVAVGLGSEPGLQQALAQARAKGIPVLEVGATLNPIPLGGSEANGRAPAGSVPGTSVAAPGPGVAPDPHIWLDPDRMKQAITMIVAAVEPLRGVDRTKLADQTKAYVAQIDKADEQVQSTLAPVPEERRRLVSVHDNLGYFADRYGFTIVGVVVPAGRAQDAPLEPAEVVSAAALVVGSHAYAIVTDPDTQSTADATDVATAVGARTDPPPIVTLHLDALGEPGSGAESYLGLLTSNAQAVAALAG